MSIAPPDTLFRFRPLDAPLLEREMGALEQSYIYAPPFAAMNDPMEAFYETGGPADVIVDALLSGQKKKVADMYKMLDDLVAKFALVSFTGTHMDLPMWAYYGSNFAGMCLEFDSRKLAISDLKTESLVPVTYATTPLPPIAFSDFSGDVREVIISRISRKRIEWAHEKEWRYIVGAAGPIHYIDDALKRVYLGPRVDPSHAARVKAVLAHRPVEILQGRIHGFDLRFEQVQAPTALGECGRIGVGKFDKDAFYLDGLEKFFGGELDALWAYCDALAQHPNLETIDDIALSGSTAGAIFLWARYRLRNDREIYHKVLLDRQLREAHAELRR